MYAIVDIAGQQFKVEAGKKIYVNRLQDVKVGAPYVEGASVTAKVLEHVKGNKVIVFKKIKRKGFDKKNGHRQCLTKIEIESIA